MVGTTSLLWHTQDDQLHHVVVSGLSPEGTCIVSVDVTKSKPQ